MEFIAILLLLLPEILWLLSSVRVLNSAILLLNKIWFAISWLFSAQKDIKYIREELAGMRAFVEKAKADPETARYKRELISQIWELANDAEDWLNEFNRLLVQPTDQEIFGHLLRSGIFLRDRVGPWFLKTRNWLLGTGAGHLFCGAVTCYFLGVACFLLISTCFLVLRINTYFRMTQLQSTRFLDGARTRILRVGPVLRTSFEHDTYWLRTGVEFSTRLLRKVHAQYWIKIEAQKLKASVELKEMRNYVVPMASNPGRSSEEYSSGLDEVIIQDSELIGIEESRNKLLDILLDKKKKQTCVLAVVGCGGLGKTTLVRKVFDSQRLIDGWSPEQMTAVEYEEASVICCRPQQARAGPEQATCRAWITVSSSFELMDFLEKMFKELSLDGFDHEGDELQLSRKIIRHLQDKRYVIVFDDVWEVGHWNFIKAVFPDNMKGSRVIVTTRNMEVARAACVHNQEHVYKLPTLSPMQSMELFRKIVFGGDSCPPYLKFLSKKILKTCGGVPLAIKSIGGVLARKPTKTVDDWKGMLVHLSYGLQTEPEIKKMMQIMALSYNALPHHLKRCFLYLSVFPEDYVIDRRQLEALWIAEGMIAHHNKMTPEEVAESYLNELVSRSMIDAAEISDRDRVKKCRVNDVMLKFIVKESVEQNLLITLNGKHGSPLPQAKIRRLSLQSSDSLGSLLENTRPDHLRSLFMFESRYCRELRSFICRCRFLRVLELHGADQSADSDLDAIGKLYHLKHLRLSGWVDISIPKSFGGLVNLETLVIQRSIRVSVPAEVFQLPRLRHLNGSCHAQPGFRCSDTLQTLDSLMSIEKVDIQGLRNLTHLTKLGIRFRFPEEGRAVCAAISEMSRSLRSLKLMFEDKTAGGCLDSLASPPMLLQSLYLEGYLGKLPRWVNYDSLQAVTKIVLTYSKLVFDAIRALQEMPNLVVLKLMRESYREEELHFSGQGFLRLKVLRLHRVYSLESLSFAAGSMPSLQVLSVRFCYRLRVVSNLSNLSSLKQVDVKPPADQVSENFITWKVIRIDGSIEEEETSADSDGSIGEEETLADDSLGGDYVLRDDIQGRLQQYVWILSGCKFNGFCLVVFIVYFFVFFFFFLHII